MKKIKIKTVSAKIIIILLSIFFVILLAATILGAMDEFFLKKKFENLNSSTLNFLIFIAIALYATLWLSFFAFFIRRIIVKPLKNLDAAINRVVKGDYNIVVPCKGYDEIANLTINFNKMTSELKANEFLSKEFAKNVSHEFKTPISIIHGYAEILEANTNNEKDREKLRIIIEESERLSAISKSLLELSKLDSTIIVKKEDIFSPSSQIKTILQSMHLLFESKNIILDTELEDFTIRNNESLLYSVWQNLISNAIKFSNNGGMIKILLRRNGKGFVFEIIDNGVGINEEDKEKIFTQFFVGDRLRNTEGSGLGLMLAKKIVDKIGGIIKFESNRNSGTKFTIDIPAVVVL